MVRPVVGSLTLVTRKIVCLSRVNIELENHLQIVGSGLAVNNQIVVISVVDLVHTRTNRRWLQEVEWSALLICDD